MRNDSAAWRCRFAFVIIAVRYTSMLLLSQNASTNGGDASRVHRGIFQQPRPTGKMCLIRTLNKGSQTGLITNLSVSLFLRNRQAVPYRSNTL